MGRHTVMTASAGRSTIYSLHTECTRKKDVKGHCLLKDLNSNDTENHWKLVGEDADQMEPPQPPAGPSYAEDAKIITSANTILTQGTEDLFEILNLAKAKVHIPLTLLTNTALWKMHEDPACVKLKKGLVLNNPKMIIMDMSSRFAPESTLTADVYFKVLSNFLKLLALVADEDTVVHFSEHHMFCMSWDEFTSNFPAILRFDIETRRRFFNSSVFLDKGAYKEHWSEVKIDSRMERDRSYNGGEVQSLHTLRERQSSWGKHVEQRKALLGRQRRDTIRQPPLHYLWSDGTRVQ
ncbi:hypothetical protein BDR07DRAFT_1386030 [Suillus spraguei]|nr:hypothetical protein BDR07DRAFT_1386030 [Suillus spraguei]